MQAIDEETLMTDRSPRVTVISSDAHAGADLRAYRPYLDSRWHEEFDRWAVDFHNPFESEHLLTNDPSVNWDTTLRNQALESQGVVAEVIFPNTVPPFYPQTQFFVPPPPQTRAEYERRWAGLQAHNRWLVDFCAELPGRRAGIAQIMLDDVDAAVAAIRWVHEVGLKGGVLVPGIPPGSRKQHLFAECYDPIWQIAEELGVVLNFHSGGGVPEYDEDPVALAILLKEVTWFANRNLAHLIYGGVFERHPGLSVAFTEQGSAWVVAELATLDSTVLVMSVDKSSQHFFGGEEMIKRLSMLPSEYFARNCYLGSSPLRLPECEMRDKIGVDRIMWGNDFPHTEGTYPYTIEAMRYVFAGVPEHEVRSMLGGTAAKVYGFDLDALAPVVARVGPPIDDVLRPLDDVPTGSLSSVFIPAVAERVRDAQRAGRV
jgi:predicted TIM-barrel fold metal-dependent hydrolase